MHEGGVEVEALRGPSGKERAAGIEIELDEEEDVWMQASNPLEGTQTKGGEEERRGRIG